MKCCAVAIVVITVLLSCKNKNSMPADVLPPEKMQKVFWDVLRTDAFAFNYIKNDTTKIPEAELVKLQTQVFAVHKTSKEQFYKSYDFYKTHPDLMQGVLDTIINKYTREKYDSYKAATPVKRDTIKTAE
jgi:Domain of unknown function (DUF4296)